MKALLKGCKLAGLPLALWGLLGLSLPQPSLAEDPALPEPVRLSELLDADTGRQRVLGSLGRLLLQLDSETGRLKHVYPVQGERVSAAAFSPDSPQGQCRHPDPVASRADAAGSAAQTAPGNAEPAALVR